MACPPKRHCAASSEQMTFAECIQAIGAEQTIVSIQDAWKPIMPATPGDRPLLFFVSREEDRYVLCPTCQIRNPMILEHTLIVEQYPAIPTRLGNLVLTKDDISFPDFLSLSVQPTLRANVYTPFGIAEIEWLFASFPTLFTVFIGADDTGTEFVGLIVARRDKLPVDTSEFPKTVSGHPVQLFESGFVECGFYPGSDMKMSMPGAELASSKGRGTLGGFVTVDGDPHVITAAHVVDDIGSVATTPGGLSATVTHSNPAIDVAVARIDGGSFFGRPCIPEKHPYCIKEGEWLSNGMPWGGSIKDEEFDGNIAAALAMPMYKLGAKTGLTKLKLFSAHAWTRRFPPGATVYTFMHKESPSRAWTRCDLYEDAIGEDGACLKGDSGALVWTPAKDSARITGVYIGRHRLPVQEGEIYVVVRATEITKEIEGLEWPRMQ